MMLQIKFKGLAIQLQSPFFCANSNTQRVMHDQPPARKLFQILLHFGKSARYFSKLDTAPQDARKPFICPNISHNLPLCPVSNLIFQTSMCGRQIFYGRRTRNVREADFTRFALPKDFFRKKIMPQRAFAANLLFFAALGGEWRNGVSVRVEQADVRLCPRFPQVPYAIYI